MGLTIKICLSGSRVRGKTDCCLGSDLFAFPVSQGDQFVEFMLGNLFVGYLSLAPLLPARISFA